MLADKDFAAYYLCYRDTPRTVNVLRHFRMVYQTAPVYLVCDGGDDFSAVAREFGCAYRRHDENIGLQIKTTQGRMAAWFNRLAMVANATDAAWILFLEDDVLIRKPMADPLYPMTGNHAPGRAFQGPLGEMIFNRHPHLKNLGYGGGGGTLIARSLISEVWDNFHTRHVYDFDTWTRWVRGWNASDLWLTACVMYLGHQYGPNPDLAETARHPHWRESDCAIIHGDGWQ
ncbi:MAG: hypothetical protein ABFD92_21480 [Planctomycetaceae bacterium]